MLRELIYTVVVCHFSEILRMRCTDCWFEKKKLWPLSFLPQHFPNFRKRGQPSEVYPNFLPEVFFLFNFALGISRIFGWIVRILEIHQFSDFPLKFSHHLQPFPHFRTFWSNGKRPMFVFCFVQKKELKIRLKTGARSARTFWPTRAVKVLTVSK